MVEWSNPSSQDLQLCYFHRGIYLLFASFFFNNMPQNFTTLLLKLAVRTSIVMKSGSLFPLI